MQENRNHIWMIKLLFLATYVTWAKKFWAWLVKKPSSGQHFLLTIWFGTYILESQQIKKTYFDLVKKLDKKKLDNIAFLVDGPQD